MFAPKTKTKTKIEQAIDIYTDAFNNYLSAFRANAPHMSPIANIVLLGELQAEMHTAFKLYESFKPRYARHES